MTKHIRKKLIEVALPLDAINTAAQAEKVNPFIKGHPRSFHQYWARRPLAAARAIIFAQMVDDPSTYVDMLLGVPDVRREAERELRKRRELWQARPLAFREATGRDEVPVQEPGPEPTLEDCAADIERQRLFEIIKDLVQWENTTNETVLEKARAEIWLSWHRACADSADNRRAGEVFNPQQLPAFHDPFAGGGALPLEAQRLGLDSYASDLNPVAVLINKAMIEVPPKFVGKRPVNPKARHEQSLDLRRWCGAQGLADDVHYYGEWMRDQAEKRIGHLYPKVEITAEMAKERPDLKPLVGKKLTVIAWLWARTVKSPNPAFADIDVPLVSTFMLSTKAGNEAYVEPVIEGGGYRFTVKIGKAKDADRTRNGTKLARGANFECLMSGAPIASEYIKATGKAHRMGVRMMAIVAEGDRGRVYLPPTRENEAAALQAKPEWGPETPLPDDPRNFWTVQYGLTTFADLFTPRQLVALTTFCDLIDEVRNQVRRDAASAEMPDDGLGLDVGGTGAAAYAEAVSTYLSLATSRWSDNSNSIASWNHANQNIRVCFTRQAIPMSWDFAELSPFAKVGDWFSVVRSSALIIRNMVPIAPGHALQADALSQETSSAKVISTDPPYYDNIEYADLSDFFYVWLRRCVGKIFPDLFVTLGAPKVNELVANPYRHGGRIAAEVFFLKGMTHAIRRLATLAHPAFPLTIYYAFKQSETERDNSTASTGWETFLEAVLQAGLAVAGTWPIKTEKTTGTKTGVSALASSIVLVCRPRSNAAPTATRREFIGALKAELPVALAHLQRGNIAPVDLAQAAIGPGMAVYTRYANVLDAEGKPLSVRQALALINQTLDEALAEQEGDFDADSRWAVTWFEQSGFAEGDYGVAEQLSKSKNTSVAGMVQAGILSSRGGKVRLFKPEELPADWDPETDPRLTAWEVAHQLIRSLETGGEGAAAALINKLGTKAEIARELAYRLYTVCERKKRAAEALSYNGLVQSWPEITRLSREETTARPTQPQLI